MNAPHVCSLCGRTHKHGSKAYSRIGTRCAKNCTRKPITARPHAWVGKGACCVCGSAVPRGSRRCKADRGTCATRALKRLRVLPYDESTETARYREAVAA